MTTLEPHAAVLDHDHLRRLCGDIPDWKLAAIMALEATPEEIEQAVAWSSGEDDVMGEKGKALTGKVAEIYDLLVADEDSDDR